LEHDKNLPVPVVDVSGIELVEMHQIRHDRV
jgi:hypothetical protein